MVLVTIGAIALVGRTTAAAPAPDLVLVNGKIFTSVADAPFVEAIAIRGERIVAIGRSSDIAALADRHTRRLELGGRTVIPGINDAHYHLGIVPPGTVDVELKTRDPSWSELEPVLAAQAAATPPGTLLTAAIGATLFNDVTVDRDRLDRVTTDHPVILGTLTGHAEILNSGALRLAHIAENVPDPQGGRFERDAHGRLTGVAREYAVLQVDRRLADDTNDDQASAQLRHTLDEALQWGVTSIQDMSDAMEPGRAVRLLRSLGSPIRVRVIRMPLTTPAGRDTREGISLPRAPAPHITVSGTKWLLDGVPLEFTLDPRGSHRHWGTGSVDELWQQLPVTFGTPVMHAMLQESLLSHDPLLVHVSGYPAAAAMLDAMEAAGGAGVWATRRVRFEHGDGLFPDLIPRAKALGIVVVQNPMHFGGLGTNVMTVSQPFRSLLEAGIPVAIGSDGPMNPFLNLMLATTHPHRTAEALSREQAVIAYTLGSAYAEFSEKELGNIAPGKLADLAVLSQDIFTIPLERLPATVSVLTLVGGQVVFDRHVLARVDSDSARAPHTDTLARRVPDGRLSSLAP